MQKRKLSLVRGILDEQAAGKVSFSADDIDKLINWNFAADNLE